MNSTNCFGCTRPQPPLLEALEARVLLSLCDGPPLYEGISAAVQLGEQVATSVRRCPAFELAISQGRLVRSEDQPGVLLAPPGIAYEDIWSLVQHNINAADTTNTDQLWSGGGLGLELAAQGLTIGVWDRYHVEAVHPEFEGRVNYGDEPVTIWGGHATHVAGTIAAAGLDPDAQGMATEINVVSHDWSGDPNEDFPDIAELRTAAQSLVASNHSYGKACGWDVAQFDFAWGQDRWADIWYGNRTLGSEDTSFGKYAYRAVELDDAAYDNPGLLSVWSAGNDRDDLFQNKHQTLYGGDSIYVTWLEADSGTVVAPYSYQGPGWYPVYNAGSTLAPGADGGDSNGYDTLTPEASAKNNLVVGAVDDVLADPYGVGDIAMSGFSSWGATDDGRIKVDVVANGVDVKSTWVYDPQTQMPQYQVMSGTSMAAPNVTGTAVLLIEHYEDLFLDRPLAATTKGLLIHTAFDAGNTGPDYAYGWGLVDAAAAANLLTDAAGSAPSSWVPEDTYDGTTCDWTLISDGSGPLKATICWTDPAGPAAGPTCTSRSASSRWPRPTARSSAARPSPSSGTAWPKSRAWRSPRRSRVAAWVGGWCRRASRTPAPSASPASSP